MLWSKNILKGRGNSTPKSALGSSLNSLYRETPVFCLPHWIRGDAPVWNWCSRLFCHRQQLLFSGKTTAPFKMRLSFALNLPPGKEQRTTCETCFLPKSTLVPLYPTTWIILTFQIHAKDWNQIILHVDEFCQQYYITIYLWLQGEKKRKVITVFRLKIQLFKDIFYIRSIQAKSLSL